MRADAAEVQRSALRSCRKKRTLPTAELINKNQDVRIYENKQAQRERDLKQ